MTCLFLLLKFEGLRIFNGFPFPFDAPFVHRERDIFVRSLAGLRVSVRAGNLTAGGRFLILISRAIFFLR